MIWECRTGKKAKLSSESKGDKFEGENFKRVYDRHVETLTMLKEKVNTYHHIMSRLYLKVT